MSIDMRYERRLFLREHRLSIHVSGRLQPEQMRVCAIDDHKFLVCPILNNFALLDHNDTIGHTDRRKPVGNEQGRGTSGDLLKLTKDLCFGLGINR
jgi:hypothetical protein